MGIIDAKLSWDTTPLPIDFANALLQEVAQAKNNAALRDEADCSGVATSNIATDKPVILTYATERYEQLYNINIVAGARSSAIGSTSFAEFNDDDRKPKLLIPFQFTGIVTAPADVAQPVYLNSFWGRLVKNFVTYLLLPLNLLNKTWDGIRAIVLKNGDAKNISQVYKGDKFLEERKQRINAGNNPLTPVNFLPSAKASSYTDIAPTQAGLGIFFTRHSHPGSIWQLTDPGRVLSPYMNSQTRFGSWELPADIHTIIIKWMSKKQGYQYNDGECYGSFKLCKKT